MSWYARSTPRRTRQVAADLGVLAWAIAWGLIGAGVRGMVAALADPFRSAGASTAAIRQRLTDAAVSAGQIPGVGNSLRAPIDQMGTQVDQLQRASVDLVAAIDRLSWVAGGLTFLIPVAVLVAVWLPIRVSFLRRSRAGARFVDSRADLDLFALRAMARQPLHRLARISDDPWGAWQAGDRDVIDALAHAELRREGLPIPRADELDGPQPSTT